MIKIKYNNCSPNFYTTFASEFGLIATAEGITE